MVVMKFGGTSVKDAEAYKRVIEIIDSRKGKEPVIVLSATAGTTDNLLKCSQHALEGSIEESNELAEQIFMKHTKIIYELVEDEDKFKEIDEGVKAYILQLKDFLQGIYLLSELSPRSVAKTLSFGELISTYILNEVLNFKGYKSKLLDSREFIITDENYLKGEPQTDEIRKKASSIVLPAVKEGFIPVAQGFIATSLSGQPSTLGRGGSDYTASLIGMALKAEEIEIWTDVDGILTADPRKVQGTKIIKEISFKEAAELAFFGAKVLHPSTIIPAIEENIPVRILNSHAPEVEGTLIKSKIRGAGAKIRSITSKEKITVLNIYSPKMLFAHGFLKKVFEVFDKHKTSVDLIATSEVNISLTLDNDDRIAGIIDELSEFSQVKISEDKSLVCIVGKDMKHTKGIVKEIFEVLGEHKISMISQGASAINVSFVVERSELTEVLQALHDRFFNHK
jgi:aspartate kinase